MSLYWLCDFDWYGLETATWKISRFQCFSCQGVCKFSEVLPLNYSVNTRLIADITCNNCEIGTCSSVGTAVAWLSGGQGFKPLPDPCRPLLFKHVCWCFYGRVVQSAGLIIFMMVCMLYSVMTMYSVEDFEVFSAQNYLH